MALVVVLCLLASAAWWALGRLAGGQAEATGGAGTAPSLGGGHGQPGRGGSPGHATGPHHKPAEKAHHKKAHRLAQPSGDCAPSKVGVVVDVADMRAGRTQPIGLKLTSVGVAACTLAITPDTLALRITSGEDVIWASQNCPNALLAREVVVRAHQPTVYEFDWNGYRSTDTCAKPGKMAPPGGYWVEVALIGAAVHRAYFDVT